MVFCTIGMGLTLHGQRVTAILQIQACLGCCSPDLHTARSASAGAGEVQGDPNGYEGTAVASRAESTLKMGCAEPGRWWGSRVHAQLQTQIQLAYWLPLSIEVSRPLLISCAGTWSGVGTEFKGNNMEVDHTNVVLCLVKSVFRGLQKSTRSE